MAVPSSTYTESAGLTDQERWQAVQTRNSRFDSVFVYAVRSTGIYCRPSCPSRRPKREHVVFFDRPEAAERAGFRPCRRCQPRAAVAPQREMVQRACRWIEAQVDEPVTLEALSRALGVSPYHLQRTFKREMGVTPRQYAEATRLARLKDQLRGGADVTSAIYEAGYGSSSVLYERAPLHLGMTPRTYRRRGEGMTITYTIADCSLGQVLIGVTERGVCAVSFGESDAELEDFLAREYPAAEVRRDDAELNHWAQALIAQIEGRQTAESLPVDVQATAFQARVWEALRRIPAGGTRSYAEIAQIIGQPGASRAVARACASNPAAVAIPCHRVVQSDGGLGGYRWGTERKRILLDREGAIPSPAGDGARES